MKTILAPIDFSESSANTVAFVSNLAVFYGANLWLYHTYVLPVSLSEYAMPIADHEKIHRSLEEEMIRFKKEVQNGLKINITIETKVECMMLREGLLLLCEKIKPDLVIMGFSGKNPVTQFIIGSNTLQAIHYLKYPVLVVPHKVEFLPVRKVGFACNFKASTSDPAIRIIKKVLTDFNPEFHILNVLSHFGVYTTADVQESRHIHEAFKEFKPEYHEIKSEDIAEGINWFVTKSKLDLLIAIPKKHNLVDKIFAQSHTKQLLLHTHIPVLCLHE